MRNMKSLIILLSCLQQIISWLQIIRMVILYFEDPWLFMFIFKKINNKWRIIYWVESYVEKNVTSETAKELNQVELMKQT